MTIQQDAEEQRIRHFLRDLGVSHTPTIPEDDWWSALYPDEPKGADDTPAGAAPDAPNPGPEESGWVRTLLRKTASGPDSKTTTSTDTDPDRADETADDPDWAEATDPDDPTERPPYRPANPARRASRRATTAYLTLAPRTRALFYNGTAAAAGYAAGIVHTVTTYLTAPGHAATGCTATALAAGGAVLAWKVSGAKSITDALSVLPVPTVVVRVIAALGVAEAGRRCAPLAVAWLAGHGSYAGLSPDQVGLLATGASLVGGLLVVNRWTRRWWPPLAWACRIPLASVLLALALYAPGVTP